MAKRQQQDPFEAPGPAAEPDPVIPAEPVPGEPVPGEAPTDTPANAAAPLDAPAFRGPTGTPMAQHVAVGAVLDERHIGIVGDDGKPVDLETALVRDSEAALNRRATQRIYEETTMPGTDATRRKLLFGENAVVPEGVYQQLCEAVKATAAERAEQKKAAAE